MVEFDERIDIHEDIIWADYKKEVSSLTEEELKDRIFFIKDIDNPTIAINSLRREVEALKNLLSEIE